MVWKYRDQSFDVISSIHGIIDITPDEIIVPVSFHDIHENLCCFHKNTGHIDICENDVQQGSLGDCWLLSALATIVKKFPKDIEACVKYSSLQYEYSVLFLFGRYIIVDHLIPVVYRNGVISRIIAPRISSQNEYWPIVLEKAIVKLFASEFCPEECRFVNINKRIQRGIPLFGCHYSDIHGGFPRWVFTLIYGITLIPLNTKNQAGSWIDTLAKKGTLACACTSTENNDTVLDDGFVYGHAYSILGVDTSRQLIRVRNPWGTYENKKYDDGIDDGSFFVDEEDFKKRFPVVCLVYRH